MSSKSTRIAAILVSLFAGVACNLPSWVVASGENYDLWAAYLRWWAAAPVVGVLFKRNAVLAAIAYTLPSAVLRFSQFIGAEVQRSNLAPFVAYIELAADILAFGLIVGLAYVAKRFAARIPPTPL